MQLRFLLQKKKKVIQVKHINLCQPKCSQLLFIFNVDYRPYHNAVFYSCFISSRILLLNFTVENDFYHNLFNKYTYYYRFISIKLRGNLLKKVSQFSIFIIICCIFFLACNSATSEQNLHTQKKFKHW